jgi:multidrug transporter EmrE-like cation transporter
VSQEPHAQGRLADWDPEEPRQVDRKDKRMLLGLILVSVVLAALAQLTLKHGVTQVTDHGKHPLQLSDPLETAKRVAASLSVWIGLLIFALSAAVWIIVLSRASLSFAYPFAALTYVLIVVFDRFVLDQNVPSLRWAGVAFVITGIVLVSRTGGHG